VSGGVAARKAWFFGDETVIGLGAGIGASEAPDAPVTTTLAQRPLVGPVRCGVGDEVDRVETGETLEGRALDWLHHDGVGYVFPERTPATVSTRVQTGSWHDINHAHGEETVSTPVFASWIDHGVAPGEESYAYVLRPGVGADAMPAVASDPGIDVLANDPAAQAVHLPAADLVGAVFYEPGRVAAADGPSLAVDDRCLLQVRERGTATVATVADPSRSLDAVTLTLGERAWTVPLPDCSQGRAAGTTVSLGEVSLGPD
jgi:chondroitin AC lyase